jgi:hypothetical protein
MTKCHPKRQINTMFSYIKLETNEHDADTPVILEPKYYSAFGLRPKSLYTSTFFHVWRICHVLVHCRTLYRDRYLLSFVYTKRSHYTVSGAGF